MSPPLGGLALLLLCGCWLPQMTNPRAPAPQGPAPDANPVSTWQPAAGLSPQAAPAAGGASAPMTLPPPRTLPMNEEIYLMSQRLATTEDDRKVLAARLQQVEGQLVEKEKALAVAMQEVQAATAQTARTREDLQKWRKDVLEVRDRMDGMEKEHKDALESIIRTLEQVLERERERGSVGKEPAPEMPKLP